MRRFMVLFFLVSILLLQDLSEGTGGREEEEEAREYWKEAMGKEEPLPEPIEELLNNPFRTKQDKFIRNFNAKSVVIIYHEPDD
ncbi:PREDICTED: uncharacterized protein LOC104821866 [Tarenaya hassleriana]|uniref:uncharacterized protein LOC104821866 n=1 Tax=Tarenaya hassleriana TaxID=28532 RepID=UPI00053C7790|nr:PREDICTED: uncharacterized protein LOC104821866 [Tarenaya hassleriana]